MERKFVTSTEFRSRAGVYIDQAAKEPVFITKHDRPARVLVDIDEYERLIAKGERRAKMDALAAEDHAKFGPLYEELAK